MGYFNYLSYVNHLPLISIVSLIILIILLLSIIDSRAGLYSIYYHLSSLLVDEGDYVESGEILGNAGSSGLATGPHLHWEVRVSGVAVNPDSFARESIIDKSNIISIIRDTIDIKGR